MAGAVKTPFCVMLPVLGFVDQLNFALVIPAEEALNGCCCPPNKVTEEGVTLTVADAITGTSAVISSAPANPFRGASVTCSATATTAKPSLDAMTLKIVRLARRFYSLFPLISQY